MLDALRRGAGSWFAKGLLFLLIISFGVWGIADVFRGRGQDTVATVGSNTITIDEFQRTYQTQLEQIRRRFGGRITAEQARAFGFDQQVLAQLIGANAIEQHARELGLGLSDATITELVTNDPAFKGADGRFNKLALDSILREAGYSERAYLAARKRDEVREQITETLVQAAATPHPMVDLLHRYREETRTVSHFDVDVAKVTVGEPDEAKLKQTYETNKARFVVPEYRRIGVLLLTVDQVAKAIDIPEADVKAAYEQGKDLYAIAERRRIEQIAFPSRAAAEAAKSKIAAGQSFTDAAAEVGAKPADIDLGLLTKSQLIDPKIADAAFSLAKDQVSDVIEGRFATVLVRATAIEAGRQKPFEEVKGEIRDRLAQEKAADEIQKLHDQIDDQRAAGKSLAEVATQLKQTLIEVAAIDKGGQTPDGKPALNDVDARRIAAAAFEQVVNADTDAIEVGDQGYAWVRVTGITPERQKTFEEVSGDVKALWIEQERRRLVAELAGKLAERASAGEALDKLAAEAGGKLETTKDFKRFGAQPTLSEAAVNQAFALPEGKATTADSKDGTTRTVVRVDAVTPAKAATQEDADKLSGEIARQIQNDVIAAYVSALQDRYTVRINEAGLRQATGASQSQ